MWWPELTVDVVQGDLQQVGNKQSAAESVASSSEEEGEWTVITKDALPVPSTANKLRTVMKGIDSLKRKIDKFRSNISMTAFHAISAVPSESSVSPLDFAAASQQLDPKSLPCSAETLEEYVSRVSTIGSVCVPVTQSLTPHLESSTQTQDMKDIQRDSVVVNGKLLRGADMGYQKIVNMIAKEIVCDSVDAEEIAQKALSVANRTFSGGIAFDNVLKIFAADELVLVVPVSAEAEPLDITVVSQPSCLVLIRAHTRYRLEPAGPGIPMVVNACLLAELRPGNLKSSRAFVFLDVLSFSS